MFRVRRPMASGATFTIQDWSDPGMSSTDRPERRGSKRLAFAGSGFGVCSSEVKIAVIPQSYGHLRP